jgi:hypothetical protein
MIEVDAAGVPMVGMSPGLFQDDPVPWGMDLICQRFRAGCSHPKDEAGDADPEPTSCHRED